MSIEEFEKRCTGIASKKNNKFNLLKLKEIGKSLGFEKISKIKITRFRCTWKIKKYLEECLGFEQELEEREQES